MHRFLAPLLSCDSFSRLLPIAELLKVCCCGLLFSCCLIKSGAVQVDFDRSCSRAIRNTVEKIVSVNKEGAVHRDCYSVANLLMKIGNPKTALATGAWAASQFKTGRYGGWTA